ncbi:hypothetical protein DRQ12_13155 [candidate division KSB1 bacterium]|nr:MAG: hypothetical protein DRQ12_13155 [candidate division KSB1 bacterium]
MEKRPLHVEIIHHVVSISSIFILPIGVASLLRGLGVTASFGKIWWSVMMIMLGLWLFFHPWRQRATHE